MQNLLVYQSLWAMALRQPGITERTDEESFAMIAAAGFDGICLDPAAHEIDDCLAKQDLFKEYELRCLLNAFPKNTEELRLLLELGKEMGSPMVNLIGTIYPLTVADSIPIINEWIAVSEDVGVPILFETHRDCITNDMFNTLQLIAAIPEMRLCADLSHYALNREISLPLDEHWTELFVQLLDRSDSFQGRVSNHEQIQVPITFDQHQDWVTQFKSWWLHGMQKWQERSGENDSLIFLCELGPPPYAITGADGRELSDRFEEAVTIKSWAEECWQQATDLSSDPKTRPES
ncbi:MAG: sugar phosphate isomerase/epimerase [Pseudomonadota bacterium]